MLAADELRKQREELLHGNECFSTFCLCRAPRGSGTWTSHKHCQEPCAAWQTAVIKTPEYCSQACLLTDRCTRKASSEKVLRALRVATTSGASALNSSLLLAICSGTPATGRLSDVHKGLPPPGIVGGSVHLIDGSYDYHHYMQVTHGYLLTQWLPAGYSPRWLMYNIKPLRALRA